MPNVLKFELSFESELVASENNNLTTLEIKEESSTRDKNIEQNPKSESKKSSHSNIILDSLDDSIKKDDIIFENISNFYNTYQNLFLSKSNNPDHNRFKKQLYRHVSKISESFEIQNNFKNNFFKYFNFNLHISEEFFKLQSYNLRGNILCYLFCKFVDVKKIILNYDFELKRSFLKAFDDEESDICPKQFIKIILILIKNQMRLFECYIKVKELKLTESPDPFENKIIDVINHDRFSKKIINIQIDELEINNIIDQISFDDFQLYMIIFNVNSSMNNKHCNMYYVPVQFIRENKNVSLNMYELEREILFGRKNKKKDEKNKFVFRSIRKYILDSFKKKFKKHITLKKFKSKFNNRYLGNNEKAIRYFYGNEVSSKNLKSLSSCKELIKLLKQSFSKKFLKIELMNCIQRKSEEHVLDMDLFGADFCKLIKNMSTRHSWNLQDIVNAIPFFEDFFDFAS